MKYYTLLLATLLLTTMSDAQTEKKISAPLSHNMQIPADPEKMMTVLVKGDVEIIKQMTAMYGGIFRFSEGDIASINIKLKYISKLAQNPSVVEIEMPHTLYKPLNDKMILGDHTNAVAVEDGSCLGGPAYNGEGVVIGIIDTGIDINHPDFKDDLGINTRIRYIWDQRQSGNPPNLFNYGTEWRDFDIDAGFCSHTDINNNSHGTIVSGIAAGNGNCSGNYHGVAPKADLIVVALDFLNPNFTIADATKYIYDRAALLGKPCVINASVGDYFSSHDGQDLESQMIGNLITDTVGRSFVCAAGNEGGSHIHFGYNVSAIDTNFIWFRYQHCTVCDTFMYLELWGDTAAFRTIKISIGVDSINLASHYFAFEGNVIPFRPINTITSSTYDTLKSSTGIPIAKIKYNRGFQNGNTSYLQMAITPMNPFVTDASHFYRLMTTGSGHFDGWSFDTQYDNIPDSSVFHAMRFFKGADTVQNIVGGFNSSDKVITVGAYANRDHFTSIVHYVNTNIDSIVYNYNPPIYPGTMYDVSSRGPARDGRIKPEITSPGLWVMAPGVLSEMYPSNWKEAVGGCDLIASGTSMASPSVAGIAALYLQYKPNASSSEVRNCIINNARLDSHVWGPIPNNAWGYGKADACLALLCAHTDVPEHHLTNSYLSNYPNPFDDQTTISYSLPESFANAKAVITINDLLGNEIRTIPLATNQGTIIFNKSQLQSGIYFYSIKVEGRTLSTKKMMVL